MEISRNEFEKALKVVEAYFVQVRNAYEKVMEERGPVDAELELKKWYWVEVGDRLRMKEDIYSMGAVRLEKGKVYEVKRKEIEGKAGVEGAYEIHIFLARDGKGDYRIKIDDWGKEWRRKKPYGDSYIDKDAAKFEIV